jgi:hypothetical protein
MRDTKPVPDGTINGRALLRNGEYFAQGGTVNKPQGMDHTRSISQDVSTQPLTGSALKALVRGWIAGTAGLPGDLEGLARKGVNWSFGPGGVNVDEAPALPTSEFYKDWLPGKQQGDEMINDVGSLFGGVGATKPVSLAKGALSRVAAAAPSPMAGSRAAMRGVIKAPGGNWLSGSVEDALKGLKAEDRMRQGGNDITLKQAQNWPGLEPEATRSLALNNFIDKQLTRYVKNDMATPNDPIRALAERGVLHKDFGFEGRPGLGRVPRAERLEAGFPEQGLAQTEQGRGWENVTDSLIRNGAAGDMLKFAQEKGYDQALNKNPWLQTVPPETKIHELLDYNASQKFGFDHLMDELRNATNINSGLPAHLRLDPASLARVSVPQAVERVAKINDWRAAQKVAADQALANNAATVLHKDYPDKGFKWVELKKQDQLPEGWQAGEKDPYTRTQFTNPKGERTYDDPTVEALRDALKYEGDTMGHCVGGYCDDVASGKSRIYSLRDAKGQPHTTIEVAPSDWYDQMKNRSLEDSKLFNAQFKAKLAETGLNPKGQSSEATELGNSVYKELFGSAPEPTINQIKGKGNKAPNPEYLPYVQDFVKSGKWSDVGDLHNAGLVPYTRGKQEIPRGLTGRTTLGVPFDEVGIPEGYYTNDELLGHMREWQNRTGNAPKFASGGSISPARQLAGRLGVMDLMPKGY